jgi:GT2 family glycosyltransferase
MRIVTKYIREGQRIPVIIPVADAEDETTRQCLSNLAASTTLPLAVYLIESSGADFAYGKSINAGIKAAEPSEFVICMDSDAFPKEGALEKLIEYYHQDSRLGYVGVELTEYSRDNAPIVGVTVKGPIGFAISCLRMKAPLYSIRQLIKMEWSWLPFLNVPKPKPGIVIIIGTATFLLSRRCYEDVGPFEEGAFYSYSNHDYAYRVMTSEKWFMSSCLESKVFHKGHTTPNPFVNVMETEGRKHFMEKWTKERMREVRRAAREGKFICK